MGSIVIREIEQKDNEQVAKNIRQVMLDLGVPKVGTAYADPSLNHLFENYNTPRAIYFVAEEDGVIIGSGGLSKLENYDGNVCELQKLFFLEQARGKGLGAKLTQACLDKAVEFGYDKVYLETMSYMEAAQKLYKKCGFQYLDAPMGDTGHFSCPVWMLKELK